MLKLKLADKRNVVSAEELDAAVQAAAPVLAQACQGEAQYADSQGWLDVQEWAGEEILRNIEAIAARVRATCDAFVLIGVGGSNNAARGVIEALKTGAGPEIIYAGNTLSANALKRMLKILEGKYIAIDCIEINF